MFCPKCGAQNDEHAGFCTKCGQVLTPAPTAQTSSPSAAGATRKVSILLGLGILFFPVLFAWFTLRKGYSALARVVSLGWCGVVLLSLIGRGEGTPTTTTTAGSAASAGVQALAETQSFIEDPCDRVSRMFGPGSPLSDLQKEEKWKAYTGRPFAWNLEVTEVSSDILGGFTVQYKCGRNSPSLIQDLQVKYDDQAKAFVMQLQKGRVYKIKGVLRSQSTLLGMTADALF